MNILDSLKSLTVNDLQNDSRKLKPGDVFLAYPGELSDGRDFIPQAIKAGAKAIIYEPTALQIETDVPLIPCNNLAKCIGQLAAEYYPVSENALNITGITGTNGKTTIAYLLAQAYEVLGNPAAYMGTLGSGRLTELITSPNTTPDALAIQRFLYQCVQEQVDHVAMEVSSHGLSLNRVDEVPFTQAIYTNLSHEHLDFHKTMDAYANAKARLFAYPSLTSVILNQDDKYSDLMCSKVLKHAKLITYGLGDGADVRAESLSLHMKGSAFDVNTPWGHLKAEIELLGRFNIYNSLAVITSLLLNGFSPGEVEAILPKLHATPGRMELALKSPVVLIDYAHTPDALKNALSSLNELKKSKLIVVFGCGGDRDKTKRPEMGGVAESYADTLIITSDNPRTENPLDIINQIADGLKKTDFIMIEDRRAAIQKALEIAKKDDLILIAGKGHETYQEINHERYPFSDLGVVQATKHA